ncbi:hypothetical protein EJ110_NYTH47971 [Nymphaea thermarum]|nr:hypothetical protein EJ110_NYTH47971 [Nymphaea thermarum]
MALAMPSGSFMAVLLLLTAVPMAFIVSLERSASSGPHIGYHSKWWFRESVEWDDRGRRFIVSCFEGGLGQIVVPDGDFSGALEEETAVAALKELPGISFLGIRVDRRRNRLLVVLADALRGRFGGVAAYDLDSWQQLFLTQLSGPDVKTLADDVAVDDDGNAYVTDAKGSKIWKVGVNGELLSTIQSDLFTERKEWYLNFIGLNGIVYHPSGFLLVIHTSTGSLFKVDVDKELVSKVEIVQGSLMFGDGMELLSATQLVVAGTPSGRLVESLDGWKTAKVIGRYIGPMHRIASAATVKDGKTYVHHIVGLGLGKSKHLITEAVFLPVNASSGWLW